MWHCAYIIFNDTGDLTNRLEVSTFASCLVLSWPFNIHRHGVVGAHRLQEKPVQRLRKWFRSQGKSHALHCLCLCHSLLALCVDIRLLAAKQLLTQADLKITTLSLACRVLSKYAGHCQVRFLRRSDLYSPWKVPREMDTTGQQSQLQVKLMHNAAVCQNCDKGRTSCWSSHTICSSNSKDSCSISQKAKLQCRSLFSRLHSWEEALLGVSS